MYASRGWGLPERSVTPVMANFGNPANLWGATGAARLTLMVFFSVGFGSSARAGEHARMPNADATADTYRKSLIDMPT